MLGRASSARNDEAAKAPRKARRFRVRFGTALYTTGSRLPISAKAVAGRATIAGAMPKKWYEYFVSVEGAPEGATPNQPSAADAVQSIAQIAATVAPPPVIQFSKPLAQITTFEDIYAAAEIKPPANGYSIMKIHDMLSSEHIKQMPAEVKRGSIMVALDAAGVKIQEVIQDAVRRDQALDGFERVRQKSVEDLEARKLEDNRKIQADLDKYVTEHKAKLQANLDEVAKQKEDFYTWRMQKQQEEQKIADCVGYFVTDNPISTSTSAGARPRSPQTTAPPEPKPST